MREPVPASHCAVACGRRLVVLAVMRLERAQPAGGERWNQIVAAQQPRVRERADAAGSRDQPDDFQRRGADARNGRRPTRADPAFEGLVGVRHEPAADERARHQRTSSGVPLGRSDGLEEVVHVEWHAEIGKPRADRPNPPHAVFALTAQKICELRGVRIDEIAEHVHVAFVQHRCDFDDRGRTSMPRAAARAAASGTAATVS